MQITAEELLLLIAKKGGSIDVDLCGAEESVAVQEAEKQGLIRVSLNAWGDQTIAVITEKGWRLVDTEEPTKLRRFIRRLLP